MARALALPGVAGKGAGVDPDQRPFFAIALRVAAAALFATMLLLIKLAGESGLRLPEIMFWRQAMCLPVLVGWLAMTGSLATLKTDRIANHGRRAVAGMFCMLCNFGATILLPLAVATTLNFAAPLFAVLIAALVLRERVGPWRWSAVLLGFAGVLAIARPAGLELAPLGVISGLIAALMIAILNYLIRDLGRTEPPIRTVFYFSLFGALLMLPALPFVATPHSAYEWLLLGGLGLLGTLGQLLLTASLRHGAVATVIAFDYTTLIWATLFGWLVWDHVPGTAIWLGAPLIVGAGLIVVWREHLLYRRPAPTGAIAAE
jgi:drug/metabolite transporter (DMT)-like permease